MKQTDAPIIPTASAPSLETLLTTLGLRRSTSVPANLPATASARPPRISTRSQHYLYALLTVVGVCHQEACHQVGVSPRTAERWKRELRAAGAEWFGREVEYEFVARYVLDATWRALVDRGLGIDRPTFTPSSIPS